MNIRAIDFLVIFLYLATVLLIGFYLKRQAAKSKNDYLLGGKSMPFWMLGISNASGMFDLSGTAWMVAIMVVYGVKSIWLPWLWPVFNQIFMMVYLSMWLRRSNAATGAEWMLFRFGDRHGAGLSHKIIIVFALLSCLSFMAYGFIGLGKFIEIFIPWQVVAPFVPFDVPAGYTAHCYGVLFTIFTACYALLGGMKSIVWADMLHYLIMMIVCIAVAAMAYSALPDAGHLHVPTGWTDLFFGKDLDLDWTKRLPAAAEKLKKDNFTPFGYFFALMAAKGILASLAGPAPNYDMQKILSTRSPREAALMSMIVNIVLLPTRYLFITGVAVLALLYFNEPGIANAVHTDFEKVLPAVLNNHIPSGLLGLVLIGLMGAFMGTFAGTFNAAQAYFVNDIYLRSVNPGAGNREITRVTYISGVVIVCVSILLGLLARDVNSILQWIVSALYGGYIASNVLKWYWWRFNSSGFFWGMLAGIVCALVCPHVFEGTLPLRYFPLILGISVAGAIAGSFAAKPTEMEVLKKFYRTVNPWGFWAPVREEVQKDEPSFVPNRQFSQDLFNVMIGIVAQTAITVAPVFLILKLPSETAIATIVFLGCSAILWKTWYRRLPQE
ncbi:sodium:solute symporter [Dyadobacter beijingensis]|uniref:Sodium:solute symporter n=1 Tax=Dyadobacter beijingensis TaxID=365489 RepID=A0ABQ2IKK2_9BACT|nr:sodium:solute symporter family protein [Dyadobacter beijingensis]GGN11122.1 sodium:solute symporter [Dyadobacter beijingensis]